VSGLTFVEATLELIDFVLQQNIHPDESRDEADAEYKQKRRADRPTR